MYKGFKERVLDLVAQIPPGKLMTYGDIAVLCGGGACCADCRGLAHFGPLDLPWQRVVNRFGGLASGYPGGKNGHKLALEAEGVPVSDDFVVIDFEKRRWRPNTEQ